MPPLDDRSIAQGNQAGARKYTNPTQYFKELIGLLQCVGRRHDLHLVFNDFVTLAACCISNRVDLANWRDREDLYMQTIKRYDRDEVEKFCQMFALLHRIFAEGGPDDVLGNVFMTLELGNAARGQFFTPMSLCRMMAAMNINTEHLASEISKKGFIPVSEPAAGAGAMIIAFAEEMAKLGFDFQRHLHATLVDVDHRAAMMSYIQMSIIGVPAIVIHGNTLTLEERSVWFTPAHIFGGWEQKLFPQRFAPQPEVQDPLHELESAQPPHG